MQASVWANGNGIYGIRVGLPNRDEHFDRSWTEIEVEVDGQFHRFPLTDSFWAHCPEVRDSGGVVIREWLRRHRALDWPRGNPPRVELLPLGGNRFRLVG
jgi:hypothetical protein